MVRLGSARHLAAYHELGCGRGWPLCTDDLRACSGRHLTSHSAVEKRLFARAKKVTKEVLFNSQRLVKHVPGGTPPTGPQSGREFGRYIHVPPKTPHILCAAPAGFYPARLPHLNGGPKIKNNSNCNCNNSNGNGNGNGNGKNKAKADARGGCCCCVAVVLALLLPLVFGIPFKARWRRWVQPLGAPRRTRGVFGRYMDVPPENSHRRHVPEGRAARGVLSFGYFSLHEQRKVTPAASA